MSSRQIVAYYNSIEPTHGYAILSRLRGEKVLTDGAAWHCHPLQALSIAMLGYPWVDMLPQPGPNDLVKRSPFKHRFMGFPISEDETMLPDRIYFDLDGVNLAQILSLAVPVIPKFEDEFK